MRPIKYLLVSMALGLFCTPVFATLLDPVFDVDFDGDPLPAGTQLFGTATIVNTDGNPDTGGYLSLTDAANGQRGSIVFADSTGGETLTGFKIEADIRMGAGTDLPADGFSFNVARPGDPVLADGLNGWATTPNGEANAPEEGTTTGLAIGFDEWQSGNPNAVDPDVVGISIRVDNVLVDQIALPTLNGAVDDATSLQTGPNLGLDALGWASLMIMLATDQTLTISYKGMLLFDDIINLAPITGGQLVVVARTGGANSNHHLDNLSFMASSEVAVPEPSVISLVLMAAIGLLLSAVKRRRRI